MQPSPIAATIGPFLPNRLCFIVSSIEKSPSSNPATLSTSQPIGLSFPPLGTMIQQPRGQLAPFLPRQRAGVRRERLQANVVGASGVMRANPRYDSRNSYEVTP